MILLDTNVLIYAFDADSPMNRWAREILRSSVLGDGAAVNPVIVTELTVGDASPGTVVSRLDAIGITLLDLPVATALRCSQAYAEYLDNRRTQPDTVPASKAPLPDFFIGSHASALQLSLATADTDRYRRYFPEVRLLTPA